MPMKDQDRTVTLTEDDLDSPESEEARAGLLAEIRVVFPMSAWDELEFLVDAFPEQVVTTFEGADAEGEEEGEEWAFYCSGMTPEQTREQVLLAVPDGWTAKIVPVRPGELTGTRIEIQRG